MGSHELPHVQGICFATDGPLGVVIAEEEADQHPVHAGLCEQ